MKDILKTYQDRLINLSASNRSLVLKKIYKKRSFDLYDLIEKEMIVEKDFLEAIFSNNHKNISILKDPLKSRKKIMAREKKKIENSRKEQLEAIKQKAINDKDLTAWDLESLESEEAKVNSEHDLLLSSLEEKVAKYIDSVVGYSNNLNYLSREISAVEKETGKYELFLGYPFVEGKFNDGTFLRAPLMLIPVSINSKDNNWNLRVSDSDILVNKVFLYGFSKYNNITLKDLGDDFSSFEDLGDDPRARLIEIYKNNKIEFDKIEDGGIIKFKDYKKDDFSIYNNGDMIVKNYMVLGQFPLSNSIYTDYERMLGMDVSNDLLHGLLINRKDDYSSYEEINLTEKDSFFYTGLDYSQEQAVKKLLQTKRLVIYGPPGTGKSYTISNIITDALCKGQRVLMVSKKKAALDVIYNKLSKVNSKIALIHDENKDKRKFYEKIKNSLLEDALGFNHSLKIKHDELSDEIERKLDGLKVIEKTLMMPREFGISLQEMYIASRAITDTNDKRYFAYKAFKNNNDLKTLTYEDVDAGLKIINKNDNICRNYINYREFADKNEFAGLVAKNYDLIEKEEIKESGRNLISVIGDAPKISSLYSLFGKYYYENKENVSEDTVIEFAKEYNDFINESLVEGEESGFSLTGLIKKIAHKEEIKKNREKYDLEFSKYKDEFLSIFNMIRARQKAVDDFVSLLDEKSSEFINSEFYLRYDIRKYVNQILDSLDAEDNIKLISVELLNMDYRAKKILNLLYNTSSGLEDFIELKDNLRQFIILDHIRNIEDEIEFADFFRNFKKYLEIVEEITALMDKKNKLTNDITLSVWNDKFNVYLDCPDFKEFKRQASKKRMLWPIRKYIEHFDELAFTLFPCWLLSPETVSDILPLKEDFFDVIIFDEASQIFVEDAIPSIFRGKTIAIAGDDKQLKPTSIFSTKFDYFEEDKTDVSNIAAFEEESLLDLAKVNYPAINLNYHYRSRYASLINFSNYAFYDGGLNIAPDIVYNEALKHQAIEYIKVEGVWEDRKNNIEASRVVELIADILKNRKRDETVGVITFNINQKDLIEDLLDSKARRDEDFAKLYMAEKNRLDGNEDISLFVKNIENVQGDERDIIIFSVGYAQNPEGKLSVNFGSLSQHGGENRLNVAVSRSKRKIYVVSSIFADDLKVSSTLNNGPKLFKKYLKYAKAVSDNDQFMVKEVLKSLCEKTNNLERVQDDFVDDLAYALKKRGHKVVIDAGNSRSKIDLAILNPETNNYVLGIECDGKTYRGIPSVRERDIHRKRFLESRKWEIIRVWSRDWWENREEVLDKVEHFLEILIENERDVALNALEIDMGDERAKKVKAKDIVGLGDRVFIKDIMTKDSFDVNIDGDETKINDFKSYILGKNLNEVFEYKGYEYQVIGIKK